MRLLYNVCEFSKVEQWCQIWGLVRTRTLGENQYFGTGACLLWILLTFTTIGQSEVVVSKPYCSQEPPETIKKKKISLLGPTLNSSESEFLGSDTEKSSQGYFN